MENRLLTNASTKSPECCGDAINPQTLLGLVNKDARGNLVHTTTLNRTW